MFLPEKKDPAPEKNSSEFITLFLNDNTANVNQKK
jgi:hypothetical protein